MGKGKTEKERLVKYAEEHFAKVNEKEKEKENAAMAAGHKKPAMKKGGKQ